ncbi:acetyl-CoA carboxylase biotin carboxyl carrier protein [Nannocystis sp.]|uniref:acetyl-CoA carboxylase biotin carboxyl carrier protein n=1 Tax=Nannocystis sp. TaxID=1962667 RepID=UPI002429FC31|nr:acetyl-CoA carboxylase biotin carboxyl carrier protein [Nannocystis sp.]MBK7824855.1 acetyl-CoA carboxylase biotin carboxyl carrier protein [Nannocystis sp.]MBK9752891.1 acetyl-CoA carboxylase biotin carboxyl carrier protein [Nannocystis sp.]
MSSEPRDNNTLPDLRYIRELAKVFRQYDLDEIEIENGEQRVLLRRSDFPAGSASAASGAGRPVVEYQVPAAPAAPAPSPSPAGGGAAAPAPAGTSEAFITSPFVGTFYRSSSPESPSFVEVGTTVQRGQTLCIVEAMKLFNELEAEFPCVIEAVLLDNAQPVEYGSKLFRIRKL